MQKQVPQLFFHQGQCLDFIRNKDYFALFADMGTGKTKIIIEKTAQLYESSFIDCLIVISPNAVAPQWEEEFDIHYPSDIFNFYLWDGVKTLKAKKEFDYYIEANTLFVFSINVEAFQSKAVAPFIQEILTKRKVFVTIDESTTIKNGSRKTKGKRSGAMRSNLILDLFENVKYKAILTGTPTPQGPFDLWSQFEFLQKDFFGMDYFYFTHRYGIMIKKKSIKGKTYNTVLDEKTYSFVKNRLSKHEKLTPRIIEEIAITFDLKTNDVITINNMDEFQSYKNLDELKKKVATITFSVKSEDCQDLPDKIYEKLYCTMTGEQEKIYKQLKKEMYSEYMHKELAVTNKLVLYLRLQMVTGGLFPYSETNIKIDKDGEEYFDTHFEYEYIKDNCKLKALLEDLEYVAPDTYIIIWSRFTGEIDLIYDSLIQNGYPCEKYYSDSGPDVIDRFKNKEFRILIANPLKGGFGLNLQIATLNYFFSNDFKSDRRMQAEKRSHRTGQTKPVIYKDLVCKNTIDERILTVLKRKEDLIDYFRSIDNKEFFEGV